MNENQYDKCFLNFVLTMQNYNEVVEYAVKTDCIENYMSLLRFLENFMFGLSIFEINNLHYVIRSQYEKYMNLKNQADNAKSMIDDLMKEISKLSEIEKQNKIKSKEIIYDKRETKSSFIKNLKQKFSKFFD